MAISHANCTHPRTPAGRRACRAGTPSAVEMAVKVELGADTLDAAAERRNRMREMQDRLESMADEPVKLTGAVARRMARQAVDAERIQPRRSGARVSATASTCVQAALHTVRGLCACGNVSGGFVRAS